MRKSSGQQIKIQEDTWIPGTSIVLEVGDTIEMLSSVTDYGSLKESDGLSKLTYKDWENMTINRLSDYLDNSNYDQDGLDEMRVAFKQAVQYVKDPDVIQFLLDNGADLRARERDGTTLLMFALWRNTSPNVIQLLIDNGADVNARNDDGITPLIRASGTLNNQKVIQVLIDNGADLHAVDEEGDTALDSAYNTKNIEAIQILTKYGVKRQKRKRSNRR